MASSSLSGSDGLVRDQLLFAQGRAELSRQLPVAPAETARMNGASARWTLLLGLAACSSAHELVPALSLHAVLVLHRRAQDVVGRGQDYALTAQLAFGGVRPRKREFAGELEPLPRMTDAVACEETALCEWARMAEESALVALGVEP